MRGKYGPSGTLRDRIAGGEKAEVFASANMAHPQSLAKAGKSGHVVMFARNRLCALVRPGLAVTPATLLEQMLSPNVKVGTSTPKADPSGDYAFEVFAKADALKAGAVPHWREKALQAYRRPGQRAAAGGTQPLRLARRRGPRRHLSSPTARPRSAAERENPGQQMSTCPKRWRSAPTMG